MSKIINKKEISEKTAVKAIITSYVCYGILSFFIFNLIKNAISSAILQNIKYNLIPMACVIPTLFGIVTFLIIHFLCRLSTIDVFRKCKMDVSKTKFVNKNLKIFFVIIILISIFYSFISLSIALNLDMQSITINTMRYGQVFSPNSTALLEKEMIDNFNNFKNYAFIDAFISEIFFVIGFISLSSFQRDMIEKYNEN